MEEKRILIIDDEEDVLETNCQVLTNAGYKVIKATSGRTGVIKARAERPDLILLDIKMPKIDGAKTTDLLKNDASTNSIPIVYLSGLVKDKELEDGHVLGSRIGDVHFVSKGQSADKLLEIVKKNIK
jgi:CheY-like chemotaxis protein